MAGGAARTVLVPRFDLPRIHRRYQTEYFGPIIDALLADRTGVCVGYLYFTGIPADTGVFTINGRVYEFSTDGVIAGTSDVEIDFSPGPANAAAAAAQTVTNVNADADREVDAIQLTGVANFAVVAFMAREDGDVGGSSDYTFTEVATNVVASAATLGAAATPTEYAGCRGTYQVTANDVARWLNGIGVPIGALSFDTAPTWTQYTCMVGGPTDASVAVRSLATVVLRWRQVNVGRYILEVVDAGAVLAAGDRIHWEASV